MSLDKRKKLSQKDKGNLVFVAGPRFGGKTTALGTLPGKTLLLEISSKESGSLGAVNMARKLDNQLDVVETVDCDDVETLVEAAIKQGYNNIAIDGLSALSVVEQEKPKVKAMLNSKGNAVFEGWRIMGTRLTDMLQHLKDTARSNQVNVVLTVALYEKADKEDVMHTHLELKGNMAEGFIKGMCPYFVVSRQARNADGKLVRVIQTYDDGMFNARLDGVFDDDNPKFFKADPAKAEPGEAIGLAAVVNFINKTKGA